MSSTSCHRAERISPMETVRSSPLSRASGLRFELLNRCMELTQQEPRPIVINSAARNNAAVGKFGEHLTVGLDELNVDLVTLWLINEQRDSLELLKRYRDTMLNSVVHVVRNEFFGTRFELYDTSHMRRDIEAAGGKSLNLPGLANRVTAALYGKRWSIEHAQTAMPFGNCIELRRWRAKVHAMFAQVVA